VPYSAPLSRKRARAKTRAESAPPRPEASSPAADRAVRLLWAGAAVATAWSFGFAIVMGSDTWWHLAAGRWIVDHRAFPLRDPFSFTRAGKPWLHHEWLADVLFDLWTRIAGVPALVWVKWALVVAAYLLLDRVIVRAGRSETAAFLSAAFAAALASPFLDIRPHLFSLLGYAAVLAAGLRAAPLPAALPLLFLVWANLHGGFFFGLAALALFALLRAWARKATEGARRVFARESALALLSAAASLVNPNGLAAWKYPLRYAFDRGSAFRQIGEWLPPFRPGGIDSPLLPAAIVLFVLSAAAALPRLWRGGGERLFAAAGLVLSAVTLAMALRSRRFVPLFGMSEAMLIAAAFDLGGAPIAGRLPDRRRRFAGAALAAAAFTFGVIRLARYPLSSRAFPHLVDREAFPVDAADALAEAGVTADVFAYYNWGGYLIWRSGGRLRPFIDGRADTVYDEETYRRYLAVLGREPSWRSVVDGSEAELVLWPRRDPEVARELVASGRWRLLFQDAAGNLLGRSGRAFPPLPERDSAGLHVRLAEEARRRNDLAEAESQARAALARNPELEAPCHMIARLEAMRGSIEAARATERGCQRVFPQPIRLAAFRRFLDALPR
jgi:hypothetical protein